MEWVGRGSSEEGGGRGLHHLVEVEVGEVALDVGELGSGLLDPLLRRPVETLKNPDGRDGGMGGS